MSINQKIKNLLIHGDVKKLSEILDISSQAVTDRLKSKKEIDSVDFINAVCRVTGKPFSYFKHVELQRDGTYYSDDEVGNLMLAAEKSDMYDVATQQAALSWKKKFEQSQERVKEVERSNEILEDNIQTKADLIAQLKKQLEQLEKKAKN